MPWPSWPPRARRSGYSSSATVRSAPGSSAGWGSAARFVGYRSGDDLADHYAAADVFAFASLTETFGNVVLEAMSSGLPVVAVRAGGVGDIVRQGRTGLLLEPGEPPAKFAAALLRLVDDAALRRDLAMSARAYAVDQTWDAIMDGLRDRYRAVVEQHGPKRPLIMV